MDYSRITPENITELKKNEVFVYGANCRGIHGAGAAKLALKWGAKMGEIRFNIQTYGIPTKDWYIQTLPIDEIKKEIDIFLNFVSASPKDSIFLVTKIGCGLAELKVQDIAPLFQKAREIKNIHLPKDFWYYLEPFYGDGF